MIYKKRLKIPKGCPEAEKGQTAQWLNQKGKKGQTMIYRVKIEQQKPQCNPGVNSGTPKGKQFLFHMWHPSCYSCYKLIVVVDIGKL